MHKRRMETEGRAQVLASAWWAEFIQFLAALAACFFASVDLEEKVEFILFFQIDRGKIARNWINSAHKTDTTTFAFASVSILPQWALLYILWSVQQLEKMFSLFFAIFLSPSFKTQDAQSLNVRTLPVGWRLKPALHIDFTISIGQRLN